MTLACLNANSPFVEDEASTVTYYFFERGFCDTCVISNPVEKVSAVHSTFPKITLFALISSERVSQYRCSYEEGAGPV